MEEYIMFSRRLMVIGGVVVVAVAAGVAYTMTQNGSSSASKNYTVAMVTDVGGVDDKSFNQSAWEGLKAWGKEHDLKQGKDGYNYFQSDSEADFATNFSQAVSAGYKLVAGVGYATHDALVNAAKANKDTNFVLLDDDAGSKYSNVSSVVFHSEQSSYLAGVAAATKAKELGDTTVGFIGGQNSETIQTFQAGYIAGVQSVDANMTVDSQFVGSFTDSAKAKTIATAMIAKGEHVIFHAAGPAGNGMFTAIKDTDTGLTADAKDKVWAIGVDMDQANMGSYKTSDGKSANFTLTSAVKAVGHGLALIADKGLKGDFPGGETTSLGLKDKGVYVTTKNLDDEEKAAVKKAQKAILDGDVAVPTTMK
jgi:basic membrane protein A